MQNLPPEIIDKIFLYTDLETCVKNKKFHLLKYMPNVTMRWAARHGYLDVIKHLHKNDKKFDSYEFRNSLILSHAAECGHLEIVKYLHEVIGMKCTEESLTWAIITNHLEIIKYLRSKGVGCTKMMIHYGSISSRPEIVEFFKTIKN